jgi:hypothetical protein
MTISIRAMAQALGVSKSQVHRDAAVGMPMASVEAARVWRAANHDMSRTVDGRIDRPAREGADAPPPGPATDVPPEAADEPATGDTAAYRAARTEREQVRLERERLDLERERGNLVEVAEVARLRYTEFRALRDALGNVAPRLKDSLATVSDPIEIERLVQAELEAVLNAFADQVLTRGVMQDEDDDEAD